MRISIASLPKLKKIKIPIVPFALVPFSWYFYFNSLEFQIQKAQCGSWKELSNNLISRIPQNQPPNVANSAAAPPFLRPKLPPSTSFSLPIFAFPKSPFQTHQTVDSLLRPQIMDGSTIWRTHHRHSPASGGGPRRAPSLYFLNIRYRRRAHASPNCHQRSPHRCNYRISLPFPPPPRQACQRNGNASPFPPPLLSLPSPPSLSRLIFFW